MGPVVAAGVSRRFHWLVYPLAGLLLTLACSRPSTTAADSLPPVSGAPPGTSATRHGELGALTAQGVVDALAHAGFATPHPLNTTAAECPAAGCEQSIATDSFRVQSFATTGAAEKFALPRGLDQAGTIVVAFAPPLPPAERQRYWDEIVKLAR